MYFALDDIPTTDVNEIHASKGNGMYWDARVGETYFCFKKDGTSYKLNIYHNLSKTD